MFNAYEAQLLTLHSINEEKINTSNKFELFPVMDSIFRRIYAAQQGPGKVCIELSRDFSRDQIDQVVRELNNLRYSAPYEFRESYWLVWIYWGTSRMIIKRKTAQDIMNIGWKGPTLDMIFQEIIEAAQNRQDHCIIEFNDYSYAHEQQVILEGYDFTVTLFRDAFYSGRGCIYLIVNWEE